MKSLAEEGDADAQTLLGSMYAEGKGGVKDGKIAMEWLLRAAKQGHAKAQFYLGAIFESGDGAPKDLTEAYKWYYLASLNDDGKGTFSSALFRIVNVMPTALVADGRRRAETWAEKHSK